MLSQFTVLSLDPGTSRLGTCITEMSMQHQSVNLIDVRTAYIDRYTREPWDVIAQTHGDRVAKLMAIEHTVHRLCRIHDVDVVVSEAPYMGRFVTAYGALIECITYARMGVMRFDQSTPFITIDPTTVKRLNGVIINKKNKGDKSKMSEVIGLNTDLIYPKSIALSKLDEHSIDAIGVAIAYRKSLGSLIPI